MEDASLELAKEPLQVSNLGGSSLVQPQYETTWFDREKERLVKEIAHVRGCLWCTTTPYSQIPAQEFEQALNNSNMLGRRLEEVLGVGKEFKTIAALWGVFGNIVGKPDEGAEEADDAVGQSGQGRQPSTQGGVPGTGSSNYYASRAP